jgi:hypothetical protein
LVERLAEACRMAGVEPAHLKILAAADEGTAVANWVCSTHPPELSTASQVRTTEARLTVNARVATDPTVLSELIRDETACWAAAHGLDHELRDLQSFRPGRPMPTHRMPLG